MDFAIIIFTCSQHKFCLVSSTATRITGHLATYCTIHIRARFRQKIKKIFLRLQNHNTHTPYYITAKLLLHVDVLHIFVLLFAFSRQLCLVFSIRLQLLSPICERRPILYMHFNHGFWYYILFFITCFLTFHLA